jgi:hypothetical protein
MYSVMLVAWIDDECGRRQQWLPVSWWFNAASATSWVAWKGWNRGGWRIGLPVVVQVPAVPVQFEWEGKSDA